MKCLLILLVVVHLGNCADEVINDYGDYDYDEETSGDNTDYYSEELTCEKDHECNQDEIRNLPTMQKLYGNKVITCCSETQSYTFIDGCTNVDRTDTFGKLACRNANADIPKLVVANVMSKCPKHCNELIDKHLDENGIEISQSSGDLTIKNARELGARNLDSLKNFTVPHYCAGYRCIGTSWKPRFEICLCPNKIDTEKIDNTVAFNLPRCCPKTKFTIKDGKRLFCEGEEQPVTSSKRFCTSDYFEAFEDFEYNVTTNMIEITKWAISRTKGGYQETTFINQADQNYCVGPTWNKVGNHVDNLQEPIKMKIFICKREPCDGKKPCVRFCGKDNLASDKRALDKALREKPKIGSINTSELSDHLSIVPKYEKSEVCSKTVEKRRDLYSSCDLSMGLSQESQTEVLLHVKGSFNNYVKEYINMDKYCIEEIEKDGRVIRAFACILKHEGGEKWFYPYIQLICCILLLATLVVYSVVPKLLNPYTSLMRHYVFNILIAFLVLAIFQLVEKKQSQLLKNTNPNVCTFIGLVVQYFYLVSFSFMAVMGNEMRMLISGSRSTDLRYRIGLAIGYGVPFFISFLTGIVEATAPRCSSIKPRFIEGSCFFSSLASKGFWWDLPIAVSLAVNVVMFGLTVWRILSLDKQQRDLGIVSGQRSHEMDRFLLFLKLFLGMGLLWVFEIFAGISSVDWHLTNILNMLQGLYIFLIFVCKRNVFEAISKMRKGSQTLTGLNLLRSKNKGPSASIMTRMSKLTSSFHRSSGPNTDPNVI